MVMSDRWYNLFIMVTMFSVFIVTSILRMMFGDEVVAALLIGLILGMLFMNCIKD